LKTKLKKTKKKKINLPTYLDTKNPILYVGLYIVQKTYPNIIRCRNYFFVFTFSYEMMCWGAFTNCVNVFLTKYPP